MKPVVSEVRREGFRIQTVNIRKASELAEKYGVHRVPTFIHVVKGKEMKRKTGALSADQLKSMWVRSYW